MSTIDFEILEDGTVSVKTEAIDEAHHVSADQLLEELQEMLGGKTQRTENKEAKAKFWIGKKVLRGGKIVASN
jgi:hypothetical protein